MNRRRWAILSAEAAVLGLVVLVVYLTLLRPDGDNALFDVDVPGDGQRIAQEPNRGDGDRAAAGRTPRVGGRTDRGEPRGSGIIEDREHAAGRGEPPPSGSAQAPSPGTGDSPTADQYLDTLARLNARVSAAHN